MPVRLKCLAPLLAAAGVLCSTVIALAQVDGRIDPDSGKDQRVYPPDLLYEYRHVRLEIEIPDMAKAAFEGRETLTVSPMGTARSELSLRAGKGLTIKSATVDGRPAQIDRQPTTVTLTFDRPIPLGTSAEVVIEYSASRPGGGGAGLTFSKDNADTPEFDPMCHAQGQPESNHMWFPIHDFPNTRMTSEVIATVPKGFQAISNGRLLGVKRFGDGRSKFHWLQDKPHASYLITLVVGKFDVVDVGGKDSARPGLWLPVYGPLGSAAVLKRNFGNTADMVAYFEKLFDEPYPWDKYANVICRDFAAGAMENTSCTTFAEFAATAPKGAVEGTNAHELCHQWFGDLCGYKSWEHLWLGEGWATFGEALWAEKIRGKAGYQRAVLGDARSARAASRGSFPRTGGAVVNNLYNDPDSRFNPMVVYAKGGWFLHTLRMQLGEEAFWGGVRLYVERHKFQQNETDDFRRCLEETSGRSLERYFKQFAMRTDVPRLSVDLAWNEDAKSLKVTVEQTQKIDADSPAFALTLPLLIDLGEGVSKVVRVEVDGTKSAAEFTLEGKPKKVVVDPEASVMCEPKIRTQLALAVPWWTDQLLTGPTYFARVQAAEALLETRSPAALRALVAMALGRDEAAKSVAREVLAARLAQPQQIGANADSDAFARSNP